MSMMRVGQVSGVFGIQGAVKVHPLTDFDDRFDAGSELHLRGAVHTVEWRRQAAGMLVLKLSGLDDRTAAEGLRGTYVEVPEEDRRPLGAGAWYVDQLLGLRVRSQSGRDLGTLDEVLERPANDVWVARTPAPDRVETLVPATREAVLAVDLPGGEVLVADWLLDVEEA
ncbi:MAG: 16S rRNA processing protein RimM [Candidatus Dormibacteraeota bacterium]|nr:16S rRNA processing protein RimM [Candidatus Dormibacteraeota bacterium]